MASVTVFLALFALLSSSNAATFSVLNPIRLFTSDSDEGCMSWRLAVEANNVQGWKVVPKECREYIANYVQGTQYLRDMDIVRASALSHATELNVAGDGKDMWVFDTDETALSNLEYYKRSDVEFGTMPYDRTKFYEWLNMGSASPILPILDLFNYVKNLGIQVVFIDSKSESIRAARASNLHNAGFMGYLSLYLKGDEDKDLSSAEFKAKIRTKLVDEGYRIVGNIGDQWSDFAGANPGERTFKVPNPLYYV